MGKTFKHFKHLDPTKDTPVIKKYMKKCSTSLVIRKMQIKITRYHHKCTRLDNINKTDRTETILGGVKTVEQQKIAYTVGFCLFFRAAPEAYGSSQATGQIGAAAASLHHSYSNTGSKPCV